MPPPDAPLVRAPAPAAPIAAPAQSRPTAATAQRAPLRLVAALAVAAVFMAFLVFDQQHWWRVKPDYVFGWIVPFFVGYVIWIRWPVLVAVIGAGRTTDRRAARRLLDAAALLVLLGGCGIFLLGAIYRAGVGVSQPGSFVLAAGFAAVLPAMFYFAAPPGSISGPAGREDARLRAAALVLFPAAVWLISAPLVSAFESALSLFLLRRVVSVVFTVFSLLGYPLVQEGNVLVLPLGRVGVADACSGIRSLTACLFAGTFLAVVSLPRLWQKAILVAAALALAFCTNLLRSLFLTAWAYAHGSDAIEGTVHDATGYAVLGLTVAGLLAILPLFRGAFWRRLLGLPAPPAPAQP